MSSVWTILFVRVCDLYHAQILTRNNACNTEQNRPDAETHNHAGSTFIYHILDKHNAQIVIIQSLHVHIRVPLCAACVSHSAHIASKYVIITKSPRLIVIQIDMTQYDTYQSQPTMHTFNKHQWRIFHKDITDGKSLQTPSLFTGYHAPWRFTSKTMLVTSLLRGMLR